MSTKTAGKQNMACCGGQAVRLQNRLRDPLCGAWVAPDSPYRLDLTGQSHRFCSEACQEDYTRALRGEATPGVAFECVMHPEHRQELPGECALCGMTLNPARIMATEGALRDSTQGPVAGVLGRLRSALRW